LRGHVIVAVVDVDEVITTFSVERTERQGDSLHNDDTRVSSDTRRYHKLIRTDFTVST